ncbi:hypothetical protein SAMN05421737_104110 [Shouchella lonarensis]|uniref:Phr family secreted Rap phosphatase inhibitor n=1 Tax=Shouchella lonarensis TaxID=1464122 RepID=A0A1G6HPF0_9BACI|nr:hypothetical protein SAMN05421737_104110 [Shouchella lonarensis]
MKKACCGIIIILFLGIFSTQGSEVSPTGGGDRNDPYSHVPSNAPSK